MKRPDLCTHPPRQWISSGVWRILMQCADPDCPAGIPGKQLRLREITDAHTITRKFVRDRFIGPDGIWYEWREVKKR